MLEAQGRFAAPLPWGGSNMTKHRLDGTATAIEIDELSVVVVEGSVTEAPDASGLFV